MFQKYFHFFKILPFILILIFGGVILNYKVISLSTQYLIFKEMKKLPRYSLILVPGAGDSVNNKFFKGRINAAVEICNSQKIKKIIVSGRNDLPGYDEPADMETALIERGISPLIIEKDYGAKRTLQSVLLAKQELKKDSVIIVSQKAHLERTLFISRANRLKAVGYIAKENYPFRYRKYRTAREVLARLKCTMDCLKIWVIG